MKPPARLEGALARVPTLPVNYDADALDLDDPGPGWNVDDRWHSIGAEPPGAPEPDGAWAIACRLIRGYEFADPSLVRAYYDPDAPLRGRNMLLELRALNLFTVHVGVRVVEVYDEERTRDGRTAHVFGWAYRTLEGHVERGEMHWEVWKWADSGEVVFHVHAVSRTATIRNPFVRIGFWALRGHERALFLDSTNRRMEQLTQRALARDSAGDAVRESSPELTARRLRDGDPAHEHLARDVERG